jgi:hypothetical protein
MSCCCLEFARLSPKGETTIVNFFYSLTWNSNRNLEPVSLHSKSHSYFFVMLFGTLLAVYYIEGKYDERYFPSGKIFWEYGNVKEY